MVTEADVESADRLRAALDRLTSIQKSVLELNQESLRIRRHIGDFDVNVDALNILATVRSKDQKGEGEKVLEDLVRYARQTGTQVDVLGSDFAPPPPDDPVLPVVERQPDQSEEKTLQDRWKLFSQLAAAIAVTFGLFALIH